MDRYEPYYGSVLYHVPFARQLPEVGAVPRAEATQQFADRVAAVSDEIPRAANDAHFTKLGDER
ncbi:MAG TPA: hypothetical protein VHS78_00810 [Candidatus Elarobacter sp.]|jgi:hypothetical protein|nr:hypothetical protein [Candidatus Elarobacter sp.]